MDIHRLESSPPVDGDLDYSVVYRYWRITCALFNAEFARYNIPIRVTCDHLTNRAAVTKMIESNEFGKCLVDFMQQGGQSISGMLYPNQIETVVDVFSRMYYNPGKCILVLGAMMCGKTTTAGASQLLGPIFFLLRGIKHFPVNLLPVRRGHEQQTHRALKMFYALHQDLLFVKPDTDKVTSLRQYRANAERLSEIVDEYSAISLANYRAFRLRGKLFDYVRKIEGRRQEDVFVCSSYARRSPKKVSPVIELCQAAKDDGFSIVIIIDEPHWGSQKQGVQHRMLMRMEAEMQDQGKEHILIAYDATPFQIANADIEVVHHRLTDDYCGPNCWYGRPLDPNAKTNNIILNKFWEFADRLDIPNLALINRGAYGSAGACKRHLSTWNKHHVLKVNWNHTQYRQHMIAALRAALHKLVLDPSDGRTRGVCLRIMKTNKATEEVIRRLNLDPAITVIKYMAATAHDSAEDAIEYAAPTGPYVCFVTGAARMADLFPSHCTHFIDLTETISNQIALMQGSYGRACGYGEPRCVVMNDKSIDFMRDYVASNGTIMMYPGRQVSTPSVTRRGAPKINIRLGADKMMTDPILATAWQRLRQEVVTLLPRIDPAKQPLTIQRRPIDFVPFWSILDEAVLRHIETNYRRLLPDIALEPRVLRPGVVVKSRRGEDLSNSMENDDPASGNGRVGFRDITVWSRKAYRSENMQEKGKYYYTIKTDNTGRVWTQGGVQPQLWVQFDRKNRRWELEVVVIRLEFAIPGRKFDTDGIYGASDHMYHSYHTEEVQLEVAERESEAIIRRAQRRANRIM